MGRGSTDPAGPPAPQPDAPRPDVPPPRPEVPPATRCPPGDLISSQPHSADQRVERAERVERVERAGSCEVQRNIEIALRGSTLGDTRIPNGEGTLVMGRHRTGGTA